MSFFGGITKFAKGEEETDKNRLNLKKTQIKRVNSLILLGIAGVIIMVMAGLFSPEADELTTNQPSVNSQGEVVSKDSNYVSNIELEERALATHLEQVLSQVAGVGQVTATVNLASTSQQEYAVNSNINNRTTEEKDQGGGTRTITETNESGQLVLVKTSQGGQELPVVIKEFKPDVKGVLVVAEGAKNVGTKVEIVRAVQTLLNIPPHKITVLPKESR